MTWGYAKLRFSAKRRKPMTPYHQITAPERYALMALQVQGLRPAAMARVLGRHRSTITRELARNATRHDGYYRPQLADWYARGRRSRSRRNRRLGTAEWQRIQELLREDWSPEQVAGRLMRSSPWRRRVPGNRARHPSAVLLRDAASRLGTWDQREHQRAAPAVSPQTPQHAATHPARLQQPRRQAQPPASQAPRLSHTGGMLCPMRLSVALQT